MKKYTPQQGDTIALDFAGIYRPAAGDIAVNFGLHKAAKTPLWHPPAGDSIALDFSGDWLPPAGDAIALGGVAGDSGGSDPGEIPEPGNIDTADFAVPWGEQIAADHTGKSGWGEKRNICRSYLFVHRQKKRVERENRSGWKTLQKKERHYLLPWGDLERVEVSVISPWQSLELLDLSEISSWDIGDATDAAKKSFWRSPGGVDYEKTFVWDDFRKLDGHLVVPWGNPPVKDLLHRTMWGKAYYERICRKDYEPPVSGEINFNLNYPLTLVGDKDHIDLFFSSDTYDIRCDQREPSGHRDNYFYDPDADKHKPVLPDALDLKTYIMLSTASLTRLPDGKPIPVKSLSLSLDWESCHWGLSAAVIDGDVRDLSPTPDGPIEIDAEIVGNHWHCIVDSWQRDRAFASDARSISGRGISAMLATPFAPKRTGVEEQERTSVQLCAAQLENTGWSIDASNWQDWNIEGGIAAWQAAAPIDVIKQVAVAAGGFVRPKINEKVLQLLPRFKKQPWLWTVDDADIVLPASMMIKDTGNWDGRPEGDIVYLVGSTGTWAVRREGTAGENPAGEITDALITDDIAARGRAIWEIGRCGRWQKHSLNLPIFADQQPGLILPGMMVAITEPKVWFGVVSSVAITANWTEGGLIVRQQIAMEVYCGN